MKLTNLYESTGKSVKDIPGYPFNDRFFDKVDDKFNCTNERLYSLEGCPEHVQGDFVCSINYLTTLEGGPLIVGGVYDCSTNQITSLKGIPKHLYGSFYCSNNNLRNFSDGPEKIDGDFLCHANKITSLVGAPQFVDGGFDCESNEITSLEGAPNILRGDLDVRNNKISSLIGVDDYISECIPHATEINFRENPIREGGLGLLLIKKLYSVNSNLEAFKVINMYLLRYVKDPSEALYDCQAKLIENGFEEFAQL